MEKGQGRTRPRGRAPRLPELVGERAPPAEDRGEEAARRARLATVIEPLWSGLHGLGRLLPSLSDTILDKLTTPRPRTDCLMEKRHGRTRRKGRAPGLSELVGKEGVPVQDHGEEATRRVRLAAVIKALWAGLQGFGRLLRSFFARRQLVEVELPVAEEEVPSLVRARVVSAKLDGDKPPPRRKREPRQPPSPPPRAPSPLLMVKGKCVSKHLEMQYKEYCRIRARVPDSLCLCHMCFFEMPRHDHMAIPKCEMIIHCKDMHLGVGKVCGVGCGVRVRTERDYELHMHFCHPDVPF